MKTTKKNLISDRFINAKKKETSKRRISFLTGLIISLSLAFTAFNLRTPLPSHPIEFALELDTLTEDIIPITVIEEKVKKEKKIVHEKIISPTPLDPISSKAKSPDKIDVVLDFDDEDDFDLDNYELEPENINDDIPHTIVQNFPTFPGECENIENEEMRKNCTVQRMYELFAKQQQYPEPMRDMNIQGQVVVSFIIEKDGSIGSIEIKRGVEGGKMLEMEAERLIGLLPKFIPGSHRGRTVRVLINIPMNFSIH